MYNTQLLESNPYISGAAQDCVSNNALSKDLQRFAGKNVKVNASFTSVSQDDKRIKEIALKLKREGTDFKLTFDNNKVATSYRNSFNEKITEINTNLTELELKNITPINDTNHKTLYLTESVARTVIGYDSFESDDARSTAEVLFEPPQPINKKNIKRLKYNCASNTVISIRQVLEREKRAIATE